MNLLVAITMLFTPIEPDFSICNGYGVDPHFAKAVAVVESGWNHNSTMAVRDKNIFGMIGKKFNNVNDSIHYFCRLIKTRYRTDNVDVIARKYCPPNSEKWAERVRGIMWNLQKKQRKY